jgi:hypothetical protein
VPKESLLITFGHVRQVYDIRAREHLGTVKIIEASPAENSQLHTLGDKPLSLRLNEVIDQDMNVLSRFFPAEVKDIGNIIREVWLKTIDILRGGHSEPHSHHTSWNLSVERPREIHLRLRVEEAPPHLTKHRRDDILVRVRLIVETRNEDTFIRSDERAPESCAEEIGPEEESVEFSRVSRDMGIETSRINALRHPGELVIRGDLLPIVKRELNRDPSVKVSRIHEKPMKRKSPYLRLARRELVVPGSIVFRAGRPHLNGVPTSFQVRSDSSHQGFSSSRDTIEVARNNECESA